MQRFGPRTLTHLSPDIRRPAYDRSQLQIGMAHIGVGAFHRCHQAEYTDDMLEARFGPWGVAGINIRPPHLGEALADQDCLFTRTLRSGNTAGIRAIGCIQKILDVVEAETDAEAAIAVLAAPSIGTITLTLTEKGYCHIPATGSLDATNRDLVHDFTSPLQPRTAIGLLVAAFERRQHTNAGPVSVVSCDNLPANGELLARLLAEFAAQRPAKMRHWIAGNVSCPSTMVDRIVPATTPADIASVAERIGALDQATVVGEPFRQWVLTDTFAGPRPPWDLAGAEFVSDVGPYELTKMRLLNAAQSTFSHLGPFFGHTYSFEAAADPLLVRFVRQMLYNESAKTLPRLDAMPAGDYIETTFRRIGNTAIQHRCHQIGTDGSQKIIQRLLRPLRDLRAAGHPAPLLTLAISAWIAYVVAGSSVFGRRWAPVDPVAARLIAMADTCGGEIPELARQVLSLEPVFGSQPPEPEMLAQTTQHLTGLLSAEPRRYVEKVVAP